MGYANPQWVKAIRTRPPSWGTSPTSTIQSPTSAGGPAHPPHRYGQRALRQRGGEANEGLIKLARKYSFRQVRPGPGHHLTLWDSFHGRTITTLKATGQEVLPQLLFPFTEGFRHARPNDIEDLKAQAETTCALSCWSWSREGGRQSLTGPIVQVKALCEKQDWLLLVDEVQTGGRTGTLFAFQQYGIQPDACSLPRASPVACPCPASWPKRSAPQWLTRGTHATTLAAIPSAAAMAARPGHSDRPGAGLKSPKKAIISAARLRASGSPAVSGTRGLGLMMGITLQEGYSNSALARKMVEAGLLVLTAGQNVIRLLPR